MENVTDALKMAAAMLLFVGALSLTVLAFSKARQASATVMDKLSGQEYFYELDNTKATRVVGIESIIPNLYSYADTSTTILFYKGLGYNNTNNTFTSIEPITLYNTETDTTRLGKSLLTKGSMSREIYGLDGDDESTRNEPWRASKAARKLFIDSLIQAIDSPKYTWSRHSIAGNTYDSANRKLQIKFEYNSTENLGVSFKDCTGSFVERIGQYNYEAVYTTDAHNVTSYDGTDVDSSVIAFNETNETIENEEKNKKKVIQYIYIP